MVHNTSWTPCAGLVVSGVWFGVVAGDGMSVAVRLRSYPRLWGGATEYVICYEGAPCARVFDGHIYALERGRWVPVSLDWLTAWFDEVMSI